MKKLGSLLAGVGVGALAGYVGSKGKKKKTDAPASAGSTSDDYEPTTTAVEEEERKQYASDLSSLPEAGLKDGGMVGYAHGGCVGGRDFGKKRK